MPAAGLPGQVVVVSRVRARGDWWRQSVRQSLLRANPSKDGDAEPRDLPRVTLAQSAGPPANRLDVDAGGLFFCALNLSEGATPCLSRSSFPAGLPFFEARRSAFPPSRCL